nr:hypothetical protein [Tanacetum cinerariifolium]
MRIEHYFLMTDYSLWEVILNGDSPVPTRFVEGVIQPVAPTTAEPKLARKNELKAHGSYDWSYQAEEEPANFALMAFLFSSFSSDTEPVETSILAATPKPASPKSTSSGKRRNRKACFVCKSVDHLIKDSDYHAKKIAQPTPRNYAHRGTHKHYASLTHTHPQKHMVPGATLTQSKPVSITAVRPVSADVPKIKVTRPRLAHPLVTKSKSPIKRHITRSPSLKTSNLPPRVTVDQAPVVSAAQGMQGKWGNPQYALKDKGVIDSGYSRHMTGNMSYLSDFEELNGGYVSFGGNPKGGKIFGKGKIKIGSGPIWLFNINSLTRTMNYQPVTAGNQTNPSVGFQDKFDAEKAGEEFDQQYVLFPVWSSGSTNHQNYNGDATFDGKEHDFDAKKTESEVNVSLSSSAQSRKQDDKTKKEAKGKIPTVGQNSPNSTNTFSAAGPSNVAASPTYGKSLFIDAFQLPNDIDMPELEDMTYSDDEDGVGAEADFNNLETFITISPIPKTRVHKDHPVSQIIGDLSSTTQTRSMTRVVKDQEPKRVHQALKDPSWIKAMQEELLQFKIQKVWVLVDLPHGKRAIGLEDPGHPDKVYKVVKAFYGLHQAPRAWYETLANYLLENGFQRGKIDQTLFIKKQKGDILLVQIYVDDIIFGLQVKQKKDGIFISQDKYVAKILRKFGLTEGKSSSTPIDTEKPLLKDPDGEDVDVHTYRSMIGSLMYLSSSRPDIMFAKQTVVATSSTEVEYVAAASCCA